MNERIKELTKQAKLDVDERWAKEEKAFYPEAHYRYSMELSERLVELVIKEFDDIVFKLSEDYLTRQLDTYDFTEKNFWSARRGVCITIENKLKERLGLK